MSKSRFSKAATQQLRLTREPQLLPGDRPAFSSQNKRAAVLMLPAIPAGHGGGHTAHRSLHASTRFPADRAVVYVAASRREAVYYNPPPAIYSH